MHKKLLRTLLAIGVVYITQAFTPLHGMNEQEQLDRQRDIMHKITKHKKNKPHYDIRKGNTKNETKKPCLRTVNVHGKTKIIESPPPPVWVVFGANRVDLAERYIVTTERYGGAKARGELVPCDECKDLWKEWYGSHKPRSAEALTHQSGSETRGCCGSQRGGQGKQLDRQSEIFTRILEHKEKERHYTTVRGERKDVRWSEKWWIRNKYKQKDKQKNGDVECWWTVFGARKTDRKEQYIVDPNGRDEEQDAERRIRCSECKNLWREWDISYQSQPHLAQALEASSEGSAWSGNGESESES